MEAADSVSRDKPTVIVVDDDPAVLRSLKFSLELEGFSVRTYADATEVLNEVTLPPFGCLVIDYDLPAVNGLELLQRLRNGQVRLPAILITSSPSKMLRESAAAAGIPIVEKPFFNHTLSDSIRGALERQDRH
ncbi:MULTISPECIES: response regulator [unclassified Mesorhizobium]|uniref:response regulator n=1 Tax=unclassified Mesorhizobium TaxID=325217 RepID=UPI002417CF65|nr:MULTISPECIES: response regulator [unclassified Mesorhizobium]WFP65821.1 response regulator [Mesorhizobium sp. WSM4904]WFP79069.1 response regulator [Mesorhizobium sp. WSM4906]